jgi:hypothetical protein
MCATVLTNIRVRSKICSSLYFICLRGAAMDLANDAIRKISEQIQQEKDSTRLLALATQLIRLLDQQRASMNRVPPSNQGQETQHAG